MSMPKLLGYWHSTNEGGEQYPDPSKMQDPEFWGNCGVPQQSVIEYLKAGRPCNHYRGYSGCRICGEILGTYEKTDGVWCWPDKLEHYVEKHNVVLPEEFIKHVGGPVKLDPAEIDKQLMSMGIKPHEQGELKFFTFHPDETFWVEWGKKWRGESYEELKARFKALATEYDRQTMVLSGGFGGLAAFTPIVAMGKEILPFVMRKIIDGGAWPWFEVMDALGKHPHVEDHERGRLHLVYAKYLQMGILPSEPL